MIPPTKDDDISLTREELDAVREAVQKLEMPVHRGNPTITQFEALEERHPKETPPERWRADFRSALNGILSNPETRLANVEENVLRAGRYADECALLYEMKRNE